MQSLRDVLANDGLAPPDRGEIRLLLGKLLRQKHPERNVNQHLEWVNDPTCTRWVVAGRIPDATRYAAQAVSAGLMLSGSITFRTNS
jgi:hypothetical protein